MLERNKIWKKQNRKLNDIKGNSFKWFKSYKSRKNDLVINILKIEHAKISHGSSRLNSFSHMSYMQNSTCNKINMLTEYHQYKIQNNKQYT